MVNTAFYFSGMRVHFNATIVALHIASVLFTLLTLYVSNKQAANDTSLKLEKEIKSASDLEKKKGADKKTNGHSYGHGKSERCDAVDMQPLGDSVTTGNGHIGKEPDKHTWGPAEQGNYVNVSVEDEMNNQIRKQKPLPAIPDKPPKPSPRLSRF